jgi:hypothetical protein
MRRQPLPSDPASSTRLPKRCSIVRHGSSAAPLGMPTAARSSMM